MCRDMWRVRFGLERRDAGVTRADERLGDVSPSYNVYLSCSPKKVECPR